MSKARAAALGEHFSPISEKCAVLRQSSERFVRVFPAFFLYA
jgi:hypothetical protein